MTAQNDNPTVRIGGYVPSSNPPVLVRYTYERMDFGSRDFRIYSFDPNNIPSSFNPESGNVSYFFTIEYTGAEKPDFVSQDAWDNSIKTSSSGFVTSVNSVLPKVIVPSALVCDNGIAGDPIIEAKNENNEPGFNWTTEYTPPELLQNFWIGGATGSQWAIAKVDGGFELTGEGVGGGALCILLNITQAEAREATQNKWIAYAHFSEVATTLNDSGALTIEVGDNVVKAQLSESAAKEGPPQMKQLGTVPYVMCFIPCWNGIIVSNGIQDTKNVVKVASQFVFKNPEASIADPSWQSGGGFKPDAPADIQITSDESTTVDMGTSVALNIINAQSQFAYLPLYFTSKCIIDSFFISESNKSGNPEQGIPPTTYEYEVFNVWTNNGSGFNINSSVNILAEIDDTTEWRYIRTELSGDFSRSAGELFGLIVRKKETKQIDIINENGSFELTWTGGGVGAAEGVNWEDCIKSVSVTIGLDGSSGSVTVDKYACAGQDAQPRQSIGGMTIDISGPPGSIGGRMWSGIGYGIGESRSVDGGEFNIQLKGIEVKLADMVLINVPFFDGMRFGEVMKFLCDYAGIALSFDGAEQGYILDSSADIASPRFDFKTGTTVQDAVNTVCEASGHTYVIQSDGMIHFFKLGDDGLPTVLGSDQSGSYPDTKMISSDVTPDFEDVRNEIVIVGLKKADALGRDVDPASLPIFPLVAKFDQYGTEPNIPWSKAMVYGVPGYTTEEDIADTVYPQIRKTTKLYEISGSVVIPGNSRIKLYDRWGEYVIIGVTHSVDLQSKSWTTSLSLASSASG